MRPFVEWTRGSRKISEIKIVLEREIILFFLLLFHNPLLFWCSKCDKYAFSLFLVRRREENWKRVEFHMCKNLTTKIYEN